MEPRGFLAELQIRRYNEDQPEIEILLEYPKQAWPTLEDVKPYCNPL